MNDFLRQQYEESRKVYLDNLAYMNRQNDEFAEQNGGTEGMTEDKRRIYDGRRNRIIRLVAYHDRAQEYIEDLHAWINDLIHDNRQATDQLKSAQEGWIKHFPRIETPTHSESQREHQRRLSILSAQMLQPDLY